MRTIRLTSLALLILAAGAAAAADDYALGPDSQPQPGVSKGTVTEHTWAKSQAYPGTSRKYWVYVPPGYDPNSPPCLMVFQDGAGFVNAKGSYRAPVVFDNLIH